MNVWLGAAIAVGVGLVIGAVARAVIVRVLSNERQPEALRGAAAGLGGLAFSLGIIGGLITALGIVDPASLEELPADLVAFVPKAISAGVLLIGANIAASFGSVAIDRSMAGASGAARRRATSGLRAALFGAAGLLAAGQLGVNTTVLNLAAAALFFSVGATFALLSGLGGRAVSAELAAGRVVAKMVHIGDYVAVGGESGVVTRVHPAALEVQTADGSSTLLPHSLLLDQPTKLRRPPDGDGT